MRDDMFKVIVERPRWGVHKAPRTKLRQERTGQSFIGMKRQALQQNAWTKDLNENLRPLERYLWKQRGRKWDDVYSEICASLDTGSTIKMHVREHLDDFVERHICIDRTGTWLGQRGIWGCPRTPEYWRAELYVDPVDGILKEVEGLRSRLGLKKVRYGDHQQSLIENRVELNAEYELRMISGIWFKVQFFDARFVELPEFECLEVPHKDYDPRWWNTRLPNQWRAVRLKQQLGKKAMKKYGLKGGAHVH